MNDSEATTDTGRSYDKVNMMDVAHTNCIHALYTAYIHIKNKVFLAVRRQLSI